jgi:hypothetical protein
MLLNLLLNLSKFSVLKRFRQLIELSARHSTRSGGTLQG